MNSWSVKDSMEDENDADGFLVLNPILSDLAILYKLELWNLEKNVALCGNRTQAPD